MNTYKKGTLTFIMFPTEEDTIVAACKELCLTLEGTDEEALRYKIKALAKEYVEDVCTHKLGEELLNQVLPTEIIREFDAYRVKKRHNNFERWKMSLGELAETLQAKSKKSSTPPKVLC